MPRFRKNQAWVCKATALFSLIFLPGSQLLYVGVNRQTKDFLSAFSAPLRETLFSRPTTTQPFNRIIDAPLRENI